MSAPNPYRCTSCAFITANYNQWELHLTTWLHQKTLWDSPGHGEAELELPHVRDHVIVVSRVPESIPLIDVAKHFSESGPIANLIFGGKELNIYGTSTPTKQIYIVFEDRAAVWRAVQEENAWLGRGRIQIGVRPMVGLLQFGTEPERMTPVRQDYGEFAGSSSSLYDQGQGHAHGDMMDMDFAGPSTSSFSRHSYTRDEPGPSSSRHSNTRDEPFVVSRLVYSSPYRRGSSSEDDYLNDEETPSKDLAIPKEGQPQGKEDSSWEMDTEDEENPVDDPDRSSFEQIRKGKITVNQSLRKYFEKGIGEIEGAEDILLMDVRNKFQSLWLQFIVEFNSKFWTLCFGFEIDSQYFEPDFLKTDSDEVRSLTLKQRFDSIPAYNASSTLEYLCSTRDNVISDLLYKKKVWKKKFLLCHTRALWAVLTNNITTKGKEGIDLSSVEKRVTLAPSKRMEFNVRLDVTFDRREEVDLPKNENIAAFVNVFLRDVSYNENGRTLRNKKLRFLVSAYEKLAMKYCNLRVKQWIGCCKDVEFKAFDDSYKLEKRQQKRKIEGHPRWRKFKRKWSLVLKEREEMQERSEKRAKLEQEKAKARRLVEEKKTPKQRQAEIELEKNYGWPRLGTRTISFGQDEVEVSIPGGTVPVVETISSQDNDNKEEMRVEDVGCVKAAEKVVVGTEQSVEIDNDQSETMEIEGNVEVEKWASGAKQVENDDTRGAIVLDIHDKAGVEVVHEVLDVNEQVDIDNSQDQLGMMENEESVKTMGELAVHDTQPGEIKLGTLQIKDDIEVVKLVVQKLVMDTEAQVTDDGNQSVIEIGEKVSEITMKLGNKATKQSEVRSERSVEIETDAVNLSGQICIQLERGKSVKLGKGGKSGLEAQMAETILVEEERADMG